MHNSIREFTEQQIKPHIGWILEREGVYLVKRPAYLFLNKYSFRVRKPENLWF